MARWLVIKSNFHSTWIFINHEEHEVENIYPFALFVF